jgi:hypothetical protein
VAVVLAEEGEEEEGEALDWASEVVPPLIFRLRRERARRLTGEPTSRSYRPFREAVGQRRRDCSVARRRRHRPPHPPRLSAA